MVDIASLAIQIDTSDVARAEKDLDRLGNRGTTAEKSAKKLGDAYKQASGDVAKVGDASKKSATGLDQLEGRGNAAERSAKKVGAAYGSASSQIEKVGKESKKSASSVNDLANSSDRMAGVARSLGPAVAGMITIESLRRAQQLSEEYTRLQARVERISTSAGAAAIAYSQLNDIARRSGSDLGETVRLWEALDRSLGDLGANDAQILRLTDTLQKIGTVGGSSAEEMNNALRQLGQGLASGVIRAEEFNSVLEGMPELAMQIAKGLGVPFKDLRQLMLDGQLTAEDVLTSLQNRAFDVDREFAKLPRTVAQAGSALRNDLGGALSELDKTIGASSNLANLIDALSKGIRFTAGDFTDQERLNQLVKERADLEKSYEQAKRRTILSSREQATYEEGLKRISGQIVEIQDRRIAQLTDEGKQLQSNKAATNEGLVGLREQAKLAGMSAIEREKYVAVQKLGANATAEERAEAEKLAAETYKLNEARKGSLAGTNQQAQAFQRLMDSLDPAAAAQRRYNEELEQLKTNLSGDQLAKAIDRLNHAIDGVDATGPGDFIEEYRKELERLEDQLDPVGKATEQYQKDVERLNDAMERGERSPERTTELLAELERQYKDNTKATSEWAQWTEGALDRVDSAFADAWRNIGDGFSSFRDSLTDAFKQMLAELAHMAITKPIIMQLGASMGIGNGTQGNNGIWGSLLGGGSASGGGGTDVLGTVNQARSLYSAYGTASSLWPALSGGYASGGFGGALSAGVSGIGSMFGLGSGAAASMAAGSTAAGYTGAAYASWAAAQGAAGAGAGAAAAGAGGLGAGMMAKLGAMASNPVGWFIAAITGMYQSGKLFDSGIRISGDKIGDYDDESSVLGKVAWAPFRVAATAIEKMDKLIGSVVGDKTAAMITGSPITQFVMEKLGSKLFGGAWETRDVGIGLGVENGSLDAQQFEYQKKKGGWFKKDKKRTLWSDLDPETAEALQQTYDATTAGVASIFESLSLTLDEGSLAGLQLAREKISTNGKTEEEIQEAVAEWFVSLGDSMTAELNKVFATGLDLDLAGMQAFVGNLQGVNEVLRYLDVSMYDMTVSGGKLAESLAAASGGLDALATNSQTYYAAFFTEAEKVEDTVDSIKRAFEAADVELVGSREAYRAMVEDIDLTSEAGQEMFSLMMALSGQAAQYFSIVEQQAAQKAAEATALLVGAVDKSYAALQRSIAAQQRDLQASAGKAASNISALTGIGNSLDAALKRLRGTSDETVKSLRAQAVMTLNSALVTARAGSSLAGFAGLQDALTVASELDTALYGSLEQFEREQGRTANLIAELEKVNGKQLTAEEELLKKYETQLSKLDAQLVFAQAQLDALNGVDSSILSVAEAIQAMNTSVVAALAAMGGDTGKNATPGNVGTLTDSVYRSVLGREADAAGLAYWQGEVASGNIRLDQLEQAIKNAAKQNGEIPGFAAGGLHSGGLRLVGENGPELEVTGPSRIYNASQTAAMLGRGGDSGSVAELRQLRAEIHNDLRQMAKFMEQTATSTRQMNQSGVQIVGTVQTKGVAA